MHAVNSVQPVHAVNSVQSVHAVTSVLLRVKRQWCGTKQQDFQIFK